MTTDPKEVYDVFFEPGEVVEIRAHGLSRSNPAWEGWAGGVGIIYGYFDNAEDFGRAAMALDAAGAAGVYFTLNPLLPDLLSRAANRLKAARKQGESTTDREVASIRWLPIDIDPVRPRGISSTAEELAAALALRDKLAGWIDREHGLGYQVRACSGNGAHLVCRIVPDLENNDTNKGIIKSCLAALAAKYSNDVVDVDKVVFNQARIWKIYGTPPRKGDHTDLRPHRRSYIDQVKKYEK